MNLVEIEKWVLNFWEENKIFRRLKEKESKAKKSFVFFEGPPTANGLPHIGHFLTRAFKDVVLRFYSFLGFKVKRRAGWDTHGLPVEVEVEKKLKIKNKKEIEDYGIEKFIQQCKESVWEYKREWEVYTKRMGFWLDLENPYITYDPFYIETLWKIIKYWFDKKILVKEKRVFPYCFRCGTVLSSHELNQPDAYKKVKDPSVYVKVKLKGKKNEYFLFWTTTPWTVIANVGLALNPNFDYGLFEKDNEYFWIEKDLGLNLFKNEPKKILKGKNLVKKEYVPVFNEVLSNFKRRTFAADFISKEEGTGFVHLACAYGQEDFEVGIKNKLPIIDYLTDEAKFNFENIKNIISNFDFLSKIEGLLFKEADPIIFEEIKRRGNLFDGSLDGTQHDYPHCWRCKTPLVYKINETLIVKTSKFKNELIKINKSINWVPEFIKDGRMGEWLLEGKDWNFGRKRFWGTPIPIWVCEKCKKEKAIGSIREISQKAKNVYYLLRHGEAISNVKNILSSEPESFENHLTKKGKDTIKKVAKKLKGKVDIIFSSPLKRTRETSEILAKELGIDIVYDLRLREIGFGVLNGKNIKEYHDLIENDPLLGYFRAPEGGENLIEVSERAYELFLEIEKKFENKRILIVSHSDVIWSLIGKMLALPKEKVAYDKKYHLKPGEFIKVNPIIPPLNFQNEIDLHRPIVDKIILDCKCGGKMKRIEEVADVWFDSGAMPFGQSLSLNPKDFPADFITEGIDQTRGWFYTLIAVSGLLGKKKPFKNVIVLGHVLDKEGKKMSKSLGNVVSPMEMMEKYGADPLRLYFYSLNSPWENKKFDEEELQNLVKNFFFLLLNIFNFYETYAKDWKRKDKLEILDKWFLIRFEDLKNKVYENFVNYKITEASREIIEFLDDFSRWWLRLSRQRFKESSAPQFVFEKVFKEYLILLAPFCPFISEYLWQKLRLKLKNKKDLAESVHLEKFPKILKIGKKEKEILEKMTKIKEITSEILAARKVLNIKVRQPLKEVYLLEKLDKDFEKLILQEANILKVKFVNEFPKGSQFYVYNKICLNIEIDTELKELYTLREIRRYIQILRKEIGLKPQEKVGVLILAKDKEIMDYLNEILFEKKLDSDFEKKLNLSKIILKDVEPNKFLTSKEVNLGDSKITLYLL
jgi:isoleucyl-tRNA synthetase